MTKSRLLALISFDLSLILLLRGFTGSGIDWDRKASFQALGVQAGLWTWLSSQSFSDPCSPYRIRLCLTHQSYWYTCFHQVQMLKELSCLDSDPYWLLAIQLCYFYVSQENEKARPPETGYLLDDLWCWVIDCWNYQPGCDLHVWAYTWISSLGSVWLMWHRWLVFLL